MGKQQIEETNDGLDYEDDNESKDRGEQGAGSDPLKAFESEVTNVVDQMVKDDKGVWQIPDDLKEKVSPQVLYAARSEKRYRDTQGAYTKERQRAKALETQATELESHIMETATMHISDQQRDELEELKLRNPDKWREKLNEYENESRRILQEKIDAAKSKGEEMSEQELRQAQLEAFVEQTGIELNDDIIARELPGGYLKDLEAGAITFDQFLQKAHEFLSTGKTIKGAKEQPGKPRPDLGKLSGGREPDRHAQNEDLVRSYDKEVF